MRITIDTAEDSLADLQRVVEIIHRALAQRGQNQSINHSSSGLPGSFINQAATTINTSQAAVQNISSNDNEESFNLNAILPGFVPKNTSLSQKKKEEIAVQQLNL